VTIPDAPSPPSEVEARLAAGWTIPAASYADPDVHAAELDRVFARHWHLAGRLDALERPGDRLVAQAGHIPVVVLRDGDGELRGFVNVCRHRGHPVALADGNAARLQCRYHGWTYALDGRLTGARRCRYEPVFDKAELSLPARRRSTRGARSSSSTRTRAPTRSPSPRPSSRPS